MSRDTVRGNPQCELCPLHRAAQFVCLMGRGRIPAKVMIVGEAPGHREDDVGKPFQGKSGKLLDELLESIDMTRDEVYITNAVRCRPPENRTPDAKEIKACSVYMKKELEEVEPDYILTLGATALKALMGKAKITEVRGQVFEMKNSKAKLMPTYHPAAALRDPKRLNPLKDDFKKFWQLINNKQPKLPKINLQVVKNRSDFHDLMDSLENCPDPELDIETNGLDRFAEGFRVHCLGIGLEDIKWILPLEIEESWVFGDFEQQKTALKKIEALSQRRNWTGHNGKFDNGVLWHVYGVRFRLADDTQLAHHLLNENDHHALKYLTRTELNGPDYDLPADKKINPQTQEDRDNLFLYCGYDLHFTRQLKTKFRKKLKEDTALETLYDKLVIPMARAYERIERNGVYIDPKRFDEVQDEVHKQVRMALRRLNRHAGREINWNSPDQVRKVLFEDLGLDSINKTAKGKDSTGEATLLRMRGQHPIVEALLDYRGSRQLETHFIEGWKERMRNGSWLYPKFKIHGTVTGRPSCEDPNLQQTPRNKLIRSMVSAPPGWVFFELDYSQIELRLAAMAAHERNMLRIFQTGGDIHLHTASEAMGVDPSEVTDEQRKSAKAINFGFIYGMWWRKFKDYAFDKYELVLTDREAENFRERFFELYPDLPDWHDRQKRVVKSLGQVRTLTGRIRHLPEVFSEDKKLRQEAERQAINSPIQGFAAELTLMAVVDICREYSDDEVQLCGTVHDATLGRIREDMVDELPKIAKMMERPTLLDYLGIELDVPIIVEGKLGNWGVGKKIERIKD